MPELSRVTRLIGAVTTASLVLTILAGAYLALYFDPSMDTVSYDGPFENLRGLEMTRAYASLLEITFEVRGGLLIRQVQNWAASVFVASLLVTLALMFFTGAFRGPRRRALRHQPADDLRLHAVDSGRRNLAALAGVRR
jgi:ubiquinol-cytochrome c reductase cytochrome b subunit